jgi:tetratricopeptide (TPR) repeat protein
MPKPALTIGLLAAMLPVAGCHRSDDASLPTPAAAAIADACAVALAPASAPSPLEIDRTIGQLQDEARRGRRSKHVLERLGYMYVAKARAANDPGAYKLAEKAAECLEAIDPADSATALLLRGHTLHQLHRFSEAEQIARRLIARRQHVLDYGLLGDVLMEQGRVAAAAEAYQRMIDLKPFYQSYTRAAHLRWLKGNVDGAIELMRMAIAAASRRDPESIAWAYTRLGIYELQRARLAEAARAADTALTYQPDYAAALHLRGRVLLAQQRSTQALGPLRQAARLNPLPEYQWTLADALRLGGLAAEAAPIEDDLITRGAVTDPRTLALFLATRRADGSRAVDLAAEELKTRADIFTLDALAWALFANGRVEEARGFVMRALEEGTRDARLFLHAAAIAGSAGRGEEAREWVKRAEEARWTLLPSERRILASLTVDASGGRGRDSEQ